MPGDMVFSEKITYYGSDPAPGDIVTFQDPDPEQGGRILISASSLWAARPSICATAASM